MEYTVVTAERLNNLIELVNKHISEGWKPKGGVAAVSVGRDAFKLYFYQAMIREKA